MAQAGLELFARLNGVIGPAVYVAKFLGANSGAFFVFDPSSGTYLFTGFFSPTNPAQHFPWGFDVEPD